jgi:hypothetical protein
MLVSSLTFGSFLAYTPRPETVQQKSSKNWMYSLKSDQIAPGSVPPQPTTIYLTERLAERIESTPLLHLFRPETILVPMPRSSLTLADGLWVPHRIANALIRAGFGLRVEAILERKKPIQKSAFCAPQDRPSPQAHYETLGIRPLLERPEHILIVDDIITRGASMIGAASVLADAHPYAQIECFAMIRTISNHEEFVTVVDPRVGKISCIDNWPHREP